jgi:hypothetical protein
MRSASPALFVVLLLQLGILATLYWPAPEQGVQPGSEALLPATLSQLDEWQISDNEGRSVALLRAAGGWVLPDLGGLPADSDKVNTALAQLGAIRSEWPIATSEAAQQRFAVAPYLFERKLTWIREGKSLATLYLGTAPGFRRVHARNAEQAAVYSITFNAFDVPANPNDWLDKTLLQVSDPLQVAGPGYRLQRQGDSWSGAAGEAADERELEALLNALAYLQVDGVAGQEQANTLDITQPQLALSIGTEAGEQQLSLYSAGDKHFARSSRYPGQAFSISAYDFDRFSTVDAERLLSPPAVADQ